MKYLLLNGPNLNLLGTREPEVYGSDALADVEDKCRAWAGELGGELQVFQSNHEGELIEAVHAARGTADGIVFNPGAFTHTSYALHDAVVAAAVPTVEIHISDVESREPWRRESRIGPACALRIFGRGVEGYKWAIRHLHYRAAHPPTTRSYGEDPDNPDTRGDLRLPDPSRGGGPHPVAVLFHGGGWRRTFARDQMDGIAVDLTRRGTATWNVEYRRLPPVGGWRDMLADGAAAVNYLRELADEFPLDLERVTAVGHSAGGHVAFFASRKAQVRPARFVPLASMLDLELSSRSHLGELVENLLGGERDYLDQLNPLNQVRQDPLGIPTWAVHGTADESVDIAQSRNYVRAAQAADETAELVEIPGAGHADFLEPNSAAWAEAARIITHVG